MSDAVDSAEAMSGADDRCKAAVDSVEARACCVARPYAHRKATMEARCGHVDGRGGGGDGRWLEPGALALLITAVEFFGPEAEFTGTATTTQTSNHQGHHQPPPRPTPRLVLKSTSEYKLCTSLARTF